MQREIESHTVLGSLTKTKIDKNMNQKETHNACKSIPSEVRTKIPSNPLALETSFLSDHADADAEVEQSRFDPAKDLVKYQKSKAFPPNQLPVWNKVRMCS